MNTPFLSIWSETNLHRIYFEFGEHLYYKSYWFHALIWLKTTNLILKEGELTKKKRRYGLKNNKRWKGGIANDLVLPYYRPNGFELYKQERFRN